MKVFLLILWCKLVESKIYDKSSILDKYASQPRTDSPVLENYSILTVLIEVQSFLLTGKGIKKVSDG